MFTFTLSSTAHFNEVNPLLNSASKVSAKNFIHVHEVDYQFKSWADKARECQSVIGGLPGNEIVLYIDGYDTFFVRDPEDLLREYMENWFPYMVFGASEKCHPDIRQIERYPEVFSRFRFLNAGLHIGPVNVCADLFETLFRSVTSVHFFDQQFWAELFLSGQHRIRLDHRCTMFQNCHEDPFEYLTREGDKITNEETETMPCIIHTPGKVSWNQINELVNHHHEFPKI